MARIVAKGFWVYANDTVTAGLFENPTASRDALDARIGLVAAAIIAADPTVTAAAAAAIATEIITKRLVSFNDEGIPSPESYSAYSEIAMVDGKFAFGIRRTGITEAAVLQVKQLRLGTEQVSEVYRIPGVVSGTVITDSTGISRLADDALDEKGRRRMSTLLSEQARLGGQTALPWLILITAGQSNSTPRDATGAVQPLHPRVYRWDGSQAVQESGPPWLGSGFAREYANRFPSHRILIVPCGRGSTGFTSTSLASPPAGYHKANSTWDRRLTSDGQNQYPSMIAKATAAKTWCGLNGGGGDYLAVLWSGGEEDRGHMSEYQIQFPGQSWQWLIDDLITQTRIDLAAPTLPWIMGLFTPETIKANLTDTVAIINAQESAPARLPYLSVVKGAPSMTEPAASDDVDGTGIHWSPEGQAERGGRMATYGMRVALNNKPGVVPSPPNTITITRSGTKARVEWLHPACELRSYAMEYSTNEGTSWAGVTLANPLATAFDLTGLTATNPLWVRGKLTGASTPTTSIYSLEAKA